MLARYTIYYPRPRPSNDPLPDGIRKDTRKHRKKQCLAPTPEMVEEYLGQPTSAAWKRYEKKYMKLLRQRYRVRRESFDEIANLARDNDVHLGCSCPTIKNPDVYRCHTVLALRFMKQKYPRLKVKFPDKTV